MKLGIPEDVPCVEYAPDAPPSSGNEEVPPSWWLRRSASDVSKPPAVVVRLDPVDLPTFARELDPSMPLAGIARWDGRLYACLTRDGVRPAWWEQVEDAELDQARAQAQKQVEKAQRKLARLRKKVGSQDAMGGPTSAPDKPADPDALMWKMGDVRRRLNHARIYQTQQLEAMMNLYALGRPEGIMPPLGGWAVSADTLRLLIEQLLEARPRLVVDCGSGASTIWQALVAQRHGIQARVVALEHDAAYAEKTRRVIAQHGLGEFAEVRTAPLEPVEIGGYDGLWYAAESYADLDGIGQLFVDGPPGTVSSDVRFPAVPMLRDRFADDCLVVLDDLRRKPEQKVARRWTELLPDFEHFTWDVEKGAACFLRR